MKTITLYDVARVAGVSYQTVSRVINQAAHVSPRTRDKVQAAMRELNYVPNRGAQLLAGKATRTLGLLTTDLALHAPSQIASAVKRRAGEVGFSVLISMIESHDWPACFSALQELQAQRVEGLVVNVPLERDVAEALAAASPVPVLFLDVGNDAQVNRLVFDADQGARLGVEHLLALGHRQLVLLAGPQTSVSARARLSGWQLALQEAGLEPRAVAYGDWSAASGYEKAHLLLAEKPDAVLVANDQMALGVLRACAEKGIRVPGQLSVIGYDDTTDSAWFTPPLTTVRQQFKEAGRRSVDWLVAQPASTDVAEQMSMDVELIVRGSTAPLHPQALQDDDLAQCLQELAARVVRRSTDL
ncbi:substrate-binding domain-containing protein [Kluyvera intermedia]|uniref:LacI family DNA-binding transcriptional regulator n=1 Tax=Kluyvera intermedia TaxID=61648 RepID=UPI001EECE9A9|nr:LacI family DNA-binding transcriptional regulator [Kluyvera intermedia]MCE9887338.1 substrate-binding domain-containing protein [Kluyvera intermedia]